MSVWIDGWVDEKRDEWVDEWVTHDILIRHKFANRLRDERSGP